MNPIEYSKKHNWKKVRYRVVFVKNDRDPTETTDIVTPDEICSFPVAVNSARLVKEEKDRAVFETYAEKEGIFLDLNNPQIDPEEKQIVIIFMDHIK